MTENTKTAGFALLREPFAANLIGKLPKESKDQTEERKQNRALGVSCRVCHGWHHKNAVHLDYVGHAAVTDRLLIVDPAWGWEPMAFSEKGLPQFDDIGGLWIRLTVLGLSRIGYGNADKKPWTDIGSREKEVIGDAIRNAAMRFGVALDLWSKEELRPAEAADDSDDPPIDGHPADVRERQDAAPPPPATGSANQPYPKADFDANFPAWKKAIESGGKTSADVLKMIATKGTLNPLQKAKIEALRKA